MNLVLSAGPESEPLDATDLQVHLRLDTDQLTAEADDLADLITDGREWVETFTRRALFTQTWDYYLDSFPLARNFIMVPFGNLQSIDSFAYTDSDGVETTLVKDEDFTVELNGDQRGRIVLPFDVEWPSVDLTPSNPVHIQFTVGWATVDAIPRNIKRAIKFVCENLYYHGDRWDVLKPIVENLLWNHRLWGTLEG